ncbi:hypothetical protein SAMN04488032_10868 [Pacificibacter marinus]|uniref:Uncharacterized protein n=1 Tax=Pacificibacter marinus TaxID=658057 RepID=A0A1Y5S527_9RHOB|nr:hypothetical protein SAMN04488032_10868 [Pacificibacter marinus]SLN31899.1 hypothetical protein PAM7971_01240 [Pacificibacter marinus]
MIRHVFGTCRNRQVGGCDVIDASKRPYMAILTAPTSQKSAKTEKRGVKTAPWTYS